MRPLLTLLSIAALLGCARHPPAKQFPDEFIPSCDQADAGAPAATEDTFLAFVDAQAAHAVLADPCRSPELTAPAPGSVLDPLTPSQFTFNPTHAVCRLPVPAHRTHGRPWWERAGELLEGTAEAAPCPPLTGESYSFKVIRFGEAKPVYRALLSVTSFTPDPVIWKAALAGRSGQTLNLSIERGVFVNGTLTQGPYTEPQPYSFPVGP